MKKTLLALAVLSALSATASAQSSVTIYGVLDAAVRYTTNEVDSKGVLGNKIALTQGAFQGGRIGFKGAEDLGNDTSAVFKLESGVSFDTGASDQQGQLFGRQAYVGLKNKSLGELDVGRQYGVVYNVLGGNYDPLGVGNINENEWQVYLYGIRFDNTLKYTNAWGPVALEVQYSFGEKTGSTGIGATTGAALSYTNGPLSFTGVLQNSKDANSKNLKVAGVGGSFATGITTAYVNYFEAKRDAGFAKAASNSGGALANTSMLGNSGNLLTRRDGVWTVGAVFQPTATMTYTVSYMHDSIKNEDSAGNSGRIASLYAIADYSLSKRTDIYVQIDRTKLGGAEVGIDSIMDFAGAPLGGASGRTGLALGLRHKF